MDNTLKEKDNVKNEKECRLGLSKQGWSPRDCDGETRGNGSRIWHVFCLNDRRFTRNMAIRRTVGAAGSGWRGDILVMKGGARHILVNTRGRDDERTANVVVKK